MNKKAKLDKINKAAEKAGMDLSIETSGLPEREAYHQALENIEKVSSATDQKAALAYLKRCRDAYALVFHEYFANQYEDLLFELGEDKVYWNYDRKEGIYNELTVSEVKGLLIKELIEEKMHDYTKEGFTRDCLARFRGMNPERGKRYEEFDADEEWFHANNGWVNLKSEKFVPHSETRLSRRKSAVDYDKKAKCPLYDKFLDVDIQIPEDAVRVLDQFSGLLLTHDISKQKMLTIIGRPASGKSTLLELWGTILGDMATQNRLTEIIGDRAKFGGSDLTGRTLCWFDEVDVKRSEMGNSLGLLITGSQIRVERKGINGIRRVPNYLKCVLTANSLPMSAEHGMYRRLIIVNFERSFYDEGCMQLDLPEKLKEEASGVLNRMIKGLKDLRKMGGFTVIEGQEDVIEDYKVSSDTIAEFLDTYFEPYHTAKVSDQPIPSKDLFTAYVEFMGGNQKGFVLTPQRFGKLLKAQPLNRFTRIKTERFTEGNRWHGLRLKDDLYEWRETDLKGMIIKRRDGSDDENMGIDKGEW